MPPTPGQQSISPSIAKAKQRKAVKHTSTQTDDFSIYSPKMQVNYLDISIAM